MKNYLHFFVMLIVLLTMSGCTAALVGGGLLHPSRPAETGEQRDYV